MIPVAGPHIDEHDVAFVAEAARDAWYQDHALYHTQFERVMRDLTDRKHAFALPSCTSAIHLALAAANIGPGDEVIVPDCTWIATAAPVHYLGATVRFADIDPNTWCLCTESVSALITPRTKAVIAVDLYGGMPDYATLTALCDSHNLLLIEDAAESIGTTLHGTSAGGFGDVSVFSFHGSKTVTTGEGGMLVTDCDHIAGRVAALQDHGRAPGDRAFCNSEIGFKYKMSAMQAALGISQVRRLPQLSAKKRWTLAQYKERLADIGGTWNPTRDGLHITPWMSTLLFDPERAVDKDELQLDLRQLGVDSRPFFRPLSSLPAFSEAPDTERARACNVHAYELAPRGINLPSALNLNSQDIATVCSALREALGCDVESRSAA